jgi:hypothetical protein
VVDKVTQRKLTGAMVWLNLAMIVILCLVLALGSLYLDLKTAQGTNKKIEKKVEKLRYQYEIHCVKEE